MPAFAIFGDVHGHLRLMFALCRRWQEATGRRFDAILQCGDMGWFPDANRIDRATRKYAKEDPDELAVSQYFATTALQRDPRVDETLAGDPAALSTVTATVYWVHGNHEDFEALRHAVGDRDIATVDRYGRLAWCRSGTAHGIAGVRVGFVGGGPEVDGASDPWQVVQPADVNALENAELDLLVTHSAPRGVGGDSSRHGSALLRRLVERAQPRWHVFGHHRDSIPAATVGSTQCRWLNDTGFERNGWLRPGCMAVFDGERVVVVDEPWLKAVTRWTWDL